MKCFKIPKRKSELGNSKIPKMKSEVGSSKIPKSKSEVGNSKIPKRDRPTRRPTEKGQKYKQW